MLHVTTNMKCVWPISDSVLQDTLSCDVMSRQDMQQKSLVCSNVLHTSLKKGRLPIFPTKMAIAAAPFKGD
jgi:hypothetical protein